MNDPQTWTKVWELTVESGDGMGGRGQRGKNWDNCNRITIKKVSIMINCLKNIFKFLNFIYLFLERKEGRKKERETSMCGYLLLAPY